MWPYNMIKSQQSAVALLAFKGWESKFTTQSTTNVFSPQSISRLSLLM